jgi:site-specific DNA recombinase
MTMTDTAPGDGTGAVIYLRVSSKEQAEKGGQAEGYSIPAQREACKRKAEALGAAVIEEFADRGESAKTADRPQLRALLEYVSVNRVKYVIVHKVDRLARNRADDVAISLALKHAGVELVSVSENIDQTPSGLLLHGIMSSIAEFYSRNLANEVIKGTTQKAKNGGTPGRAPVGYLNVRTFENGRESRTVEVDPDRGPLMAWAFEAYATGNWTVRGLLAELNARGLTTVPSRRSAGLPLAVSHIHKLLRNPYYIGLVRYRGVIYPGKHEPLVTKKTWEEVQKLLTAKDLAGEYQREHPHYLKGSVFCGQCHSRLIICNAKGNGGTYPYFICIGRQRDKDSCKQRAIHVDQAEAAVADYYATVQLPETDVKRLHTYLGEQLEQLAQDAAREQAIQTRRLAKLDRERKKLLDAHYADAIPLDLLKSEQQRMAAETAAIEGRVAALAGDFKAAQTNLQRALARVGDCQSAYEDAPDKIRRQFNQAFFKRILITDDLEVDAELAEPFNTLLSDELRKAAINQEAHETQQLIQEAHRRRNHNDDDESAGDADLPVSSTPMLPGLFPGDGFSQKILVRMRGLEPPPSCLDTDLNRAAGIHIRPPASKPSYPSQFPDASDASDDLTVATMLPRLTRPSPLICCGLAMSACPLVTCAVQRRSAAVWGCERRRSRTAEFELARAAPAR